MAKFPVEMRNQPRPLDATPFVLLRHNQQRVEAALREGNYDAVFPSGRNHFGEVVAFLVSTGVFALFERFRFKRERSGIPDPLTIRALLAAVLLRCPSIRKIPEVLFTGHGVLRFLGFNAQVLAAGFNKRGGDGKELPFSHETVYDLWGEERIEEESIGEVRDAYLRPLFGQRLVREALAAGARIKQLIVGRAYIDGAWMRELAELGIGLLVRVREGMQIFADLEGHGRAADAPWEEKEVDRRIEGRKVRYPAASDAAGVRVLLVRHLETWDSYQGPLTGLLVEHTPLEGPKAGQSQRIALVTPRDYDDPWALLAHWGKRWRIENSGNRELKEGFLLEKGWWSGHPTSRVRRGRAVALSGRASAAELLLRVIAYNTFRLYVSAQGQGWVIRGLRELHRQVFARGGLFVIVEAEGCFGIFSIVAFAHLLGKGPRLQGRPPPYLSVGEEAAIG